MNVRIYIGNEHHAHHAQSIVDMINDAAGKRGTGIAKRSADYISKKINEGKAVMALSEGKPVGFCYIETWSNVKYIANSGLIVHEDFRGSGLAAKIKKRAFELTRELYPKAKLFGITTSLPVMKINSDLGYKPVTFSELTDDKAFWKGCEGCKNHDILLRNDHKMCLCTGMLYTPKDNGKPTPEVKETRWEIFKRFVSIRKIIKQRKLKK
ncbi:MAG: GNAT family N-acetyltransferase [Bacteroidota bacterium]